MAVLSDSARTKRTINFSDLPDATAEVKAIPTVYQGMRWTGISYMHKVWANATYPKSGYSGAFMPDGSSHAAYFKVEGSLSIQSAISVFTLVSITVCAAWNDGLELIITGHRESRQTDTHTVILLFGKPQMILLQWENIDKIIFKASGGALHPESGLAAGNTHVVLTQVVLS